MKVKNRITASQERNELFNHESSCNAGLSICGMKKRPQVRGRISKEAEEDYSRLAEERPAERAAWVDGSRTEEDQTHLRPLFL
jgi:hypothetical protein